MVCHHSSLVSILWCTIQLCFMYFLDFKPKQYFEWSRMNWNISDFRLKSVDVIFVYYRYSEGSTRILHKFIAIVCLTSIDRNWQERIWIPNERCKIFSPFASVINFGWVFLWWPKNFSANSSKQITLFKIRYGLQCAWPIFVECVVAYNHVSNWIL